MLEVRLLGQFDVRLDGKPVVIPSRAAQALLAYLVINRGSAHRREKLAGLLWPDTSEANARRNLRQELWRLRKALTSEDLRADELSIAFHLSSADWLDVSILETASVQSASANDLIGALSVYHGELLPGFYDEWVPLERERLQAVFEQQMQRLLERLVEERRWAEVLAWGERWIALGQSPEPAYRALMIAHAALGDIAKVAAVFERCVEALRNDLGVEPSEQTQALYKRLRRGEQASSVPAEATLQSRYRLEAEIGRGGMGVVYRAYDTLLDRAVAVKVLSPALLGAEGRTRLLREAQRTAKLNHPNIVSVHDAGEANGRPFIVMELVEGQTLYSHHPSTLAEQLSIARQICAALEYAHAHNIVHRDLKPENVLIAPDGVVKLTDFGLARSISSRISTEGRIGGTVFYLAPEQVTEQTLDRRADLYALGVMLYELTTGRLPFQADDPLAVLYQHLHAPVIPPRTLRPEIPPALDALIVRLMSKQPAERFASATDVLEELDQLAGSESSMAAGELSLQPGALAVTGQAATPGRVPARRGAGTPRRMDAPFQAPPDVPHFVGREKELAELRDALMRTSSAQIYCLAGMGGVGKTTLAIRLAHTLRDQFPDGVLWAHAATSEPLAILESWARAYRCDFSGVPDLDSRAAALRGVLADKKILIVLDDVRRAATIRPLLAARSDCPVLLTTRNFELAAALDARVISLSVLSPQEARRLLVGILGGERLAAEEAVGSEMCHLLEQLPLAVEIAAQRLASRPRWKLREMLERLRDAQHRLHELKIGDREVRTSFVVSWEALDESLRRSFALLSVFEGRAFTTAAFAAVADVHERDAQESLDSLVALSLLSAERQIHYRQHPLLADFAREQLGADEAAHARLTLYYLRYATERQHNFAELEAAWDSLSAGLRVAYHWRMWQVVLDYCQVLADVWFARGHHSDARQGYQWACEAARVLGNQRALAHCLQQWGRACTDQSDYAEAEEHLSHSLQLYQRLDDQRGVVATQYYLGWTAYKKSDYGEAQRWFAESLVIKEQLGDRSGVAKILYRQGQIFYAFQQYEEAEQLGKRALDIQQEINDNSGCIATLSLLAQVSNAQGHYDLAEQYCHRALQLCEETQEQDQLAWVLYTLSGVNRRQGKLLPAREHAGRSLALLQRSGDRKSQAQALFDLSRIDLELKDYALALDEGFQSLQLSRNLQDAWGNVYILRQLGDVHRSLNQLDRAIELWSEALGIAEKLQHPLAASVRERLMQASAQPEPSGTSSGLNT